MDDIVIYFKNCLTKLTCAYVRSVLQVIVQAIHLKLERQKLKNKWWREKKETGNRSWFISLIFNST